MASIVEQIKSLYGQVKCLREEIEECCNNGGGGGSTLEVKSEGVSVVKPAAVLNFTGSGVTVIDAGSNEATIDINNQIVYDEVYDTEVEILALDPVFHSNKTYWAFDTKAAYIAANNTELAIWHWQKLTIEYDEITDTFKLPATYLGQTQDLGQELFFLGVNNSAINVTELEPRLFLGLGRDAVFTDRLSCSLAKASDIKNGDVYGVSTTAASAGKAVVVTTYGEIKGVKTDQWVVNSVLYASAVPGELTDVRPEAGARIIAEVSVSHATEGVLSINTVQNLSLEKDSSIYTNRIVHLTGDLDGTNYFASESLGSVATATSLVAVANNTTVNLPVYHIGDAPAPADRTITKGERTATLSYSVDSLQGQEKFYIEGYLVDDLGAIVNAPSGLPAGSLGFVPLGVLESTIINTLIADEEINVNLIGEVPVNMILPAGYRVLFQIRCEKIGTAGGDKTFTLYFGSDHDSKIIGLMRVTTDTVENVSSVPGNTTTEALNYLLNLGGDGGGDFVTIDTEQTITGKKAFVLPITGHSFIKTGATANDVLLGDGSTTPLSSLGGGKWIDGTDPLDAAYMTGNVGINTLTPTEKLDVNGNALINGDVSLGTGLATDDNELNIHGNNSGTPVYFSIKNVGSSAELKTNNTYLALNPATYIAAYKPIIAYQGLWFNNNTFFRIAEKSGAWTDLMGLDNNNIVKFGTINPVSEAGDIAFYVSGVEETRITSNGLHVGGIDPKAKLDVAGGIKIADDTDIASVDKVGTFRHKVVADVSITEVCNQTGVGTYAWEAFGGGGGSSPTNLGYIASALNGIVTSSTGDNATLPLATTVNAGLFSPEDKVKLDGIDGSGGIIPTLQEVTTAGNTTNLNLRSTNQVEAYTNDNLRVTLTSGAIDIYGGSANNRIGIYGVAGHMQVRNGSSFKTILQFPTATASRTINLQDGDGTLAFLSDIPDAGNFVTVDTVQAITGYKTFETGAKFIEDNILAFGTGSLTKLGIKYISATDLNEFGLYADLVVVNSTDDTEKFRFSRVTGDFTAVGNSRANAFIKIGGTSDQILLADGSTTPLSGIGGGVFPTTRAEYNASLTDGDFGFLNSANIWTSTNRFIFPVTADSFVKIGGTPDDILLGDGSTTSLADIIAGGGGTFPGTMAEYNASCTDGTFAFVGANNTFTGTNTITAGLLRFNHDRPLIFGTNTQMTLYYNFTAGRNQLDLKANFVITDNFATDRFTFTRTTGDFTATGNVTSNAFIKAGATANDVLLGDGSTTNLGNWVTIDTGQTITGYKTFDNSCKFTDNKSIAFGTNTKMGIGYNTTNSLNEIGLWVDLIVTNLTDDSQKFRFGRVTGDLTIARHSIAVDHINTSDRRLKSEIEDYTPKPVKTRWRKYIKNGVEEVGVIADELEQTNPEFVVKGETPDDMDGVKYIGLLVAKVAELEGRNDKLEARLDRLENLLKDRL